MASLIAATLVPDTTTTTTTTSEPAVRSRASAAAAAAAADSSDDGGGDDAHAMPASELKPVFRDHLVRVHNAPPSTAMRALFVAGRVLDIVACYALARWGGSRFGFGGADRPEDGSISAVHTLQLVLVVVGVARHIQWITSTATHPLPLASNLQVVASNLAIDLTWTMCGFGKQLGVWQLAAVVLFGVGVFVETYSEHQRATFKADPRHHGALYTGGLFRWAQHINYTGYCMWRIGSACCSGSVVALAVVMGVCGVMTLHSLPNLRQYLYTRYGNRAMREWTRVTPYKLVPGVW